MLNVFLNYCSSSSASPPEGKWFGEGGVSPRSLQPGMIANPRDPAGFIHTSAIEQRDRVDYHWHIEIIPKLMRIAGFEWGSGFYINPTPPELAAKYLREAKI